MENLLKEGKKISSSSLMGSGVAAWMCPCVSGVCQSFPRAFGPEALMEPGQCQTQKSCLAKGRDLYREAGRLHTAVGPKSFST